MGCGWPSSGFQDRDAPRWTVSLGLLPAAEFSFVGFDALKSGGCTLPTNCLARYPVLVSVCSTVSADAPLIYGFSATTHSPTSLPAGVGLRQLDLMELAVRGFLGKGGAGGSQEREYARYQVEFLHVCIP